MSAVVSSGSSSSFSSSFQNLDVYGTATILAGATIQDTIVHNGGSAYIYGSSVAVDASSGGGYIVVESGGAVKTANISGIAGSAAEIVVASGGTISGDAANIGADGILTVASGGSVTSAYIKSGGTLVVSSGATLIDPILKSGGNIEFASYQYGSNVSAYFTPSNPGDTKSKNGTITVTDGVTSQTITLNHWGNSDPLSAGPIGLISAADGNVEIEACFLAGGMISTPDGDVAVETLQAGDAVLVYEDGSEVARPLVWAGKAHATVRTDLPVDLAGYPVRIVKDAIAEGVPYRDMLITSEHSLYLDGRFVPARMLVNGTSIFYDTSFTSYDYYHLETAEHSVIKADGVRTESYLDTGNRHTFRQAGNVATLRIGAGKTWQAHAAAVLDVSRAFVEPLHLRIAQRAESLGYVAPSAHPELTRDPELRLEADNGMIIRPARNVDDRVMFMVPTGVQSVRILSKTARPSDVVGAFVDDRRELGVLVGEVKLFDAALTRSIDIHLQEAALEGWDAPEVTRCRWTSGNAVLPLGDRHPNGIALLAIQILSAGPYRVNAEIPIRKALASA